MAQAVEADMAEHEGAGPLDFPPFHRASKKAEQLPKLAWSLWEAGTPEDQAVDTLRLDAGWEVEQLRIAEWNLRATGYVRENFDCYECWSLLCRASRADPEPLPPENERLAQAVEEFLELPRSTQVAVLLSKEPRSAELIESVRAGRRFGTEADLAAGQPEVDLRRLVGPRSLSNDPLVRSYTARDVASKELAM